MEEYQLNFKFIDEPMSLKELEDTLEEHKELLARSGRAVAEQAIKSLKKETIKNRLKELKATWEQEAQTDREAASGALSLYDPKKADNGDQAAILVLAQGSLSRALMCDAMVARIDEELGEETKQTLDRIPGETTEEYKERILMYARSL